jgi:glutathione peroxidase-family protein
LSIAEGRVVYQNQGKEIEQIFITTRQTGNSVYKKVIMALFKQGERIEYIAIQNFHYDNYDGHLCCLERVEVNGKYGLACKEEVEGAGTHTHILLQPIYNEIHIRKISSPKANFDRYAVIADGEQVGEFTMVVNAWTTHSNN